MRRAVLVATVLFLLSTPAHAQACTKVVSFALADASGIHLFMGTGNWIANWVQKNAKKYPDMCFSQTPSGGHANYLIVLSQSANYFTGFDPVVRTNTSTSSGPVSGNGTVTDNYGEMWNYTYNGTTTTTTTTTDHENVPYTINSNTIFAYAYAEGGAIVSRRYHVFSSKSGGDAANTAGYNIGSALASINARGRLLGSVVKDIEGQPLYANPPRQAAQSPASVVAPESALRSPDQQTQPTAPPSTTAASAANQSHTKGSCEIEITSAPSGAEIELDGSFVGDTPSTIDVPTGDHTIAIKKTGFKPWGRKIKANIGKISISAELEIGTTKEPAELGDKAEAVGTNAEAAHQVPAQDAPTANTSEAVGSLSVTSDPNGADVYVDDSPVGKTPVTFSLKSGRHYLRMFMNGYNNWSQLIIVKTSSETQVAATLVKSD